MVLLETSILTIMLMIHLTQETLELNIMGKFGKEKLTQKDLKLKITKNKTIITTIKIKEEKK
ncbi:hypothetical protein XBO1_2550016 [Xenorhabdus bovienii str. oregonense]|uniref:Uncharacterized protein n=1 Tax=Xenorhabdus bovienii str. oregonense TaxID=1398202 RepID=A0A077PBV6_XENBV|nr:hypothetical protein XBO1_2550016 [Xenorhabdus bovienii str. oregonense]